MYLCYPDLNTKQIWYVLDLNILVIWYSVNTLNTLKCCIIKKVYHLHVF